MMQIGTLSGNPIAAAAGLKTLEILKRPGAYERIFKTGRALMEGYAEILKRARVKARVVGDAPMFDVVFTDREVKDYRSALGDEATMKRLQRAAARARHPEGREQVLHLARAHGRGRCLHARRLRLRHRRAAGRAGGLSPQIRRWPGRFCSRIGIDRWQQCATFRKARLPIVVSANAWPTWRVECNGYHGASRPDGWRCAAAVGPAHGPERHLARLRLRPAPLAVEGARQPLRRVRRRPWADHAAAEQHGDGAHDRLVHGAGGRRPRLGPCDPARRERGDHAHRAAPLVQRLARSHRSCSSSESSPSAAAPAAGSRTWVVSPSGSGWCCWRCTSCSIRSHPPRAHRACACCSAPSPAIR